MAQERGQDIHSAISDTILIPGSDVTDGNNTGLFGTDASPVAGIDLGSGILPERLAFKWIQTTLGGALASGFLFVHWSPNDSDYSDIDNGAPIAIMDCEASADVEKCGEFKVLMRYFKLSIFNESGGTFDFTSANSAIAMWANFGDNL